MKTKLILVSGTEIIVEHSMQEIEAMIPVSGFLTLKKENNGNVQVSPESVVYREELPTI